MTSLLKHTPREEASSRDSFLTGFEKQLSLMRDLEEVERLMKKLQFLGLNFDPFQQETGSECDQILEQLGLRSLMVNPYESTNILLRLLDKTEEKLKTLKQ